MYINFRFSFFFFSLIILLASDLIFAVPVQIFRSGNGKTPITGDLPRAQDALVGGKPGRMEDPNQNVPAQVGTCVGLSCNSDKSTQKGKNVYSIDSDDPAIKNSGFTATDDGGKDGHAAGHWSIQSNNDMSAQDLQNGLSGLPWKKTS